MKSGAIITLYKRICYSCKLIGSILEWVIEYQFKFNKYIFLLRFEMSAKFKYQLGYSLF